MKRLAVLVFLVSTIAAPAVAQVINGETPLDETTLNRETPEQAVTDRAAPQPPPHEPARSVAPTRTDDRHE